MQRKRLFASSANTSVRCIWLTGRTWLGWAKASQCHHMFQIRVWLRLHTMIGVLLLGRPGIPAKVPRDILPFVCGLRRPQVL